MKSHKKYTDSLKDYKVYTVRSYIKIKATREGGVLLLNSAVYLVVKVFYCADIEG